MRHTQAEVEQDAIDETCEPWVGLASLSEGGGAVLGGVDLGHDGQQAGTAIEVLLDPVQSIEFSLVVVGQPPGRIGRIWRRVLSVGFAHEAGQLVLLAAGDRAVGAAAARTRILGIFGVANTAYPHWCSSKDEMF